MRYNFTFLLILISCVVAAQQSIPNGAQKLLKAYPTTIKEYSNGHLIMFDSSKIKYTESAGKDHKELINSNDIGDIFTYSYKKGIVDNIPRNYDPGRIRNEGLLKKMYGTTANEVQHNLVTIT